MKTDAGIARFTKVLTAVILIALAAYAFLYVRLAVA